MEHNTRKAGLGRRIRGKAAACRLYGAKRQDAGPEAITVIVRSRLLWTWFGQDLCRGTGPAA